MLKERQKMGVNYMLRLSYMLREDERFRKLQVTTELSFKEDERLFKLYVTTELHHVTAEIHHFTADL